MASSWLLSLKVAFLSAGVLSVALMLKFSLPVTVEFLYYELPHLWSVVVSWLKPPYLYLVLNCIILTIVASTKLRPQKSDADGSAVETVQLQAKVGVHEHVTFADPVPIKPVICESDSVSVDSPVLFGYVDDVVEDVLEVRPVEKTVVQVEVETGDGAAPEERLNGSESECEEFVVSRSSWMPPRRTDPVEYYNVSSEKPLVSQRFANRKSVKASPEASTETNLPARSPEHISVNTIDAYPFSGGKALGVSKPKRQDTLESTWRMITEGRPMPLTRHIRKSETMNTQARRDDSRSPSPAHMMKKSETFKDRTNINNSPLSPSPGGGSGRIRKEPSPSQDELNRRVEAFIRKFNQEMRLQREEPLNHYKKTVGRRPR